jgi:hypothetical protein
MLSFKYDAYYTHVDRDFSCYFNMQKTEKKT